MATQAPADLPDDVEELRALLLLQQEQHADALTQHAEEKAQSEAQLQSLEQTLENYKAENERLAEAVRLLKNQRFTPRSERSEPLGPGLFNEAELLCDAPQGETDTSANDEVDVPGHKRRKSGRKPLPEHLPRVEVVLDVPESEKICDHDPSHTLTPIGEERSSRLIHKPAELYVEEEIRPKYACTACKEGIVCHAPSPQPIPKSNASASVLAQIATSKYVDGLPLARQEKIYARIGVDLPRATMARWMIRCAELTGPLTDRLLERLREGAYVLADETPFQVLKEKGRRAQSQSYLWALRLEDPEHPLLYYEYAATRSGEVVRALLDGFEGFLQTDGYSGYDALGRQSGIVHVGCFAHARRKFDEALRGQGKGKGSPSRAKHRLAQQGLHRINALFKLEKTYADGRPEERHRLRQEKLAPLLEDLRTWIDSVRGRVPPTSLVGKAIDYLDRQWPKLARVLEDGRLELSTNAVERAIRPFVIGRKAWLFADTPSGAQASARLYSLVETAKANGVEPWRYLDAIFTRLPVAQTQADYEALMPWRLAEELGARPRPS